MPDELIKFMGIYVLVTCFKLSSHCALHKNEELSKCDITFKLRDMMEMSHNGHDEIFSSLRWSYHPKETHVNVLLDNHR